METRLHMSVLWLCIIQMFIFVLSEEFEYVNKLCGDVWCLFGVVIFNFYSICALVGLYPTKEKVHSSLDCQVKCMW